MGKVICRKCGKTYDREEWDECPFCARREFEKRKKYPYPPFFDFPKRVRYWWCKNG